MEVDQKKAILSFYKELMVTARKDYLLDVSRQNKVYTKSNQKPTCCKQAG
ncbi:hypothetical protein [Brevibacillus laterosporus]|nr:hypothetical protein [Brevibacillus laterosporus]NKQ20523.1 hypothetical protein [Brevibacillus laterosporus]WNX32577.1 hypothetical protein RWW94_07185 [Brevibacillus laterosporus]